MGLLQRLFQRRAAASAPATEAPLTARRKLGNRGEDFALELLKKRGHKLVARNVSCKSGELDLVTWHKDTLVFTEVRTRSSVDFGTPAESVDARKQEKLRRAAQWFLARHYRKGPQPNCRFDLVWLLAKDGEPVESGVIEGAFV